MSPSVDRRKKSLLQALRQSAAAVSAEGKSDVPEAKQHLRECVETVPQPGEHAVALLAAHAGLQLLVACMLHTPQE